RGPYSQREPRTRHVALWNLAHNPGFLRPDYHPISVALSLAAAAFLWDCGHGQHTRWMWNCGLAGSGEAATSSGRDDQTRPAYDLHRGAAACRTEHAGSPSAW